MRVAATFMTMFASSPSVPVHPPVSGAGGVGRRPLSVVEDGQRGGGHDVHSCSDTRSSATTASAPRIGRGPFDPRRVQPDPYAFFTVLREILNRRAMAEIAKPPPYEADGSLPSPPRLAPPDLQEVVKVQPEPSGQLSARADTDDAQTAGQIGDSLGVWNASSFDRAAKNSVAADLAVICDDAPWPRSIQVYQQDIRDDARRYPIAGALWRATSGPVRSGQPSRSNHSSRSPATGRRTYSS
jgi:hypothetical protein